MKKRERRRREKEREKNDGRGRERKRKKATIATLAVSSSERAHGLGRCCGVIQSRFRPMNFLRREEGDPAAAGRGRRGGEDESTNRADTGPGVQATDWSGP